MMPTCGFNSTLVRLKGVGRGNAYQLSGIPFQFHTGSIKSVNRHIDALYQEKFQFHTGSIKRSSHPIRFTRPLPSFNSTLVRLKVAKVRGLNAALLHVFQFHTGSIKSRSKRSVFRDARQSWFQFHTGSIKRLGKELFRVTKDGFQFHTGSIKSSVIPVRLCKEYSGFNSTLVRLKADAAGKRSICPVVSIPHWFD